MKTVLYHNQSCSKSQDTYKILNDLSIDYEVVNYLTNPPSKEELKKILSMLAIPAEELVRKNEQIFLQNYLDKKLSEDEWIDAMIEHPILIERPIVVHGYKAAIGRPIEKILNLFNPN